MKQGISFIQQIFTMYPLCAWGCFKCWDTAMGQSSGLPVDELVNLLNSYSLVACVAITVALQVKSQD